MQAGYTLQSSVADVMNNGEWGWPQAWLDLFPVLITLPKPVLQVAECDALVWKDLAGNEQPYSSSLVWDSIRSRSNEVEWARAVWFSHCIPRHSFLVWLIIRQRLVTQDKLMIWKPSYNLYCCSLCKRGHDSHPHLFFECSFSSQVWKEIKMRAEVPWLSNSWGDILQWLVSKAKSRSAKNVVGRLLVAAAAYYIWQERNNRLFTPKSRSKDQIVELIFSAIRLKLVTLRFKDTRSVDRLLQVWKVPRDIVIRPR